MLDDVQCQERQLGQQNVPSPPSGHVIVRRDDISVASSIQSDKRKRSMDTALTNDLTANTSSHTISDLGDFSEGSNDVSDALKDMKIDDRTGWSPSAGPKGTFDELLESFPGE